MCTIDRMLIRGIRSFAPENNTAIVFYKPLTLIVGSNGAGKTTIIECLKQACTGELPPNVGGNGRNWVMDPKVYGEAEVKAQIKLLMTTSNQMPVVVVRSYQSVQKKSGQAAFKTLDSTVQTKNRETGRKEAVTYRCADINALVPQLMGVSKAILDNVIFVHQEESNWPLADGATIKKKFDEIFSATKYTKALESLRKLRLEKQQEVREMKLKLETLKSYKDAAAQLQRDAANGAAQGEALAADIQRLQQEVASLEAEMEQVDNQLAMIASIADQIARLKAQAEVLARTSGEQLARLTSGDFEESDEELQDALAKFDRQDKDVEAVREQQSAALKKTQLDHASYEERIQAAQQQLSRLQAAAEAHVSNVAARDAFVRTTSHQLGITLPGEPQQQQQQQQPGQQQQQQPGQQQQPLPQAALEYFRGELQHREGQLQAELAALKESHRAQEAALTSQIDAANAELAGAQQTAKMKEGDLAQLERRRDNLHQQLMLHTSAPYQADELQRQVEEVGRRLEGKKGEEGRSNFDGQIAELRAEMERQNGQLNSLRAERDRAIMADDVAGRLRAARNSLAAAKDRYAAQLAGPSAQKLVELIGSPSPLPHGSELRRLADVKLRAREAEVTQKREAAKELDRRATVAENELTGKRREKVAALDQVQMHRAKLRTGISSLAPPLPAEVLAALNAEQEGLAYSTALANLQKEREGVSQNAKTAQAACTVTTFFEDQSRAEGCCALCKRAFNGPQDLVLLNNVASMQEDFPQRKEAYDKQLADLEAQVDTLLALSSSAAMLQSLQGTLPRLTAAEEAAVKAVDESKAEAEAASEQLALAEAELVPVRRAIGEAGWSLAKQAQEVDELNAAAEQAAAAAAAAGTTAAGRDREEIDAELASVESSLRHTEISRDEVMKRQSKLKDERVRLSEHLASLMEELRRATDANRQRQELSTQLSDVTEQISQLTSVISAASAAVGPAQAKRDDLLTRRDGLKQQHGAAEGQLEGQIRVVAAAQEGLSAKQRLVDEYAAANKGAAQRDLAASLEGLRDQRDAAAREVQDLQAEVESSVRQLAEREATRLEIAAVCDYRRTRAHHAALDAEVAQLQAQITQVGDRTQLEARRSEAQAARAAALQGCNQAQGRLSVVRENMRTAQRGLADPRYHQIMGRHRKAMIELRTTELAAGDLQKWHKALEQALLAFHTGKMADINAIIKELWQKTYRGQDIDYIQIKADADHGTSRSYNYRVVMVNGGIEMEMRGRCSAGQKVLACLIIRLALAEAFCLKCGILALDEPTTNLDADNSASLADALRAVMAARRDQDNFQLMVITHDEHFAHLIGTRQHAEHLWRITKDDNQRSLITQEEILE